MSNLSKLVESGTKFEGNFVGIVYGFFGLYIIESYVI